MSVRIFPVNLDRIIVGQNPDRIMNNTRRKEDARRGKKRVNFGLLRLGLVGFGWSRMVSES